jgi:hypothetical protein
MPNGVFPVPEFRPVPSRARPSMAVRILTRLKRPGLDVELSGGADPAARAELHLRAAQLSSPAERRRLANALVGAIGDARGPNLGSFRAKARLRHAVVRENADELRALALRLRDDRPVEVRGAAMVARLVDDRTSPLHRIGRRNLHAAIGAARLALDATGETAQPLAAAA